MFGKKKRMIEQQRLLIAELEQKITGLTAENTSYAERIADVERRESGIGRAISEATAAADTITAAWDAFTGAVTGIKGVASMDTVVGVLRGMGSSVAPMIVSVMGACVFRLFWIAVIYPFNPTLNMLYMSYPISWFITLSVHLICYFHLKRKKYSA